MVDSSAAVGIANRKGNGKLRHVRVGQLWIQGKVEDEELDISKVNGEDNPADMMTKSLPANTTQKHMDNINQEFRVGRAKESLKIS